MSFMQSQRGFFGLGRSQRGAEQAAGATKDNELRHAERMIEEVPVAVMMCDRNLTITYANKASREALKKIEHVLPIRASAVIGQSIDIFHKDPSHQRRLLADPRNLPHNARIKVGDEWLDLKVSAVMDAQGEYVGPMLAWSVVTDLVRKEFEAKRLLTMLDLMPINVMLAERDSLEITYANRTSINTLRPLEQHLPCKASEIIGKNIDIFHKNPSHQRRVLGDPQRTLPHRAIISLGNDKLELNVSALNDEKGAYLGPMVTWSVVTESINVATKMEEVVATVSAAATEMRASADAMRSTADRGQEKAANVASAAEQLSASISEISRQIAKTQQITNHAQGESRRSLEIVGGLAEAANKIGRVLNLINDIADQTNLLALNATIEAARAGEAGKGFAVVAAEVKALANQTAQATGDISEQVTGIQQATDAVVKANEAINRTVGEMTEISATVAAAVEEQSAATQNVAANIAEVSTASGETGRISSDVNSAAGELAERSAELNGEVTRFLERIRGKK